MKRGKLKSFSTCLHCCVNTCTVNKVEGASREREGTRHCAPWQLQSSQSPDAVCCFHFLHNNSCVVVLNQMYSYSNIHLNKWIISILCSQCLMIWSAYIAQQWQESIQVQHCCTWTLFLRTSCAIE